MKIRLLQLSGVVAAFVAVVVLLKVAAAPAVNQQRPGGAAPRRVTGGSPPRTPWGDPDLQGIWAAEFTTPLQRPTKYADKEFFTEEERAELNRQRAEIVGVDPLSR